VRLALLNLTAGGLSGGSRKYLWEMITRLQNEPCIKDIIVGLPSDDHVHEYSKVYKDISFFSLSSTLQTRKELKNFNPDVIFIPNTRYIKFGQVPVINMVRNMEPMFNVRGNPLSEKAKNYLRRLVFEKDARRADHVIAVSEFVKDTIIKQWQINPDKISTIHHGVSFDRGARTEKPLSVPANWEGQYIFTAGSIRPGRGLEDILEVLDDVLTGYPHIKGLVVAGEPGKGMAAYKSHLDTIIKGRKLEKKVLWLGQVGEAEMRWCYSKCKVYVMTSRVEACPNTVLEALSHGCTCISNDADPMPEFFGDAAIYYNDRNRNSILSAFEEILSRSREEEADSYMAAVKRSEMFTWDHTVEKTINAIKFFENADESRL